MNDLVYLGDTRPERADSGDLIHGMLDSVVMLAGQAGKAVEEPWRRIGMEPGLADAIRRHGSLAVVDTERGWRL